MFQKKIYKILSFLVAVIITASVFIVPVAAETKPYTVRMPFSKPAVSINSGYMEILVPSGDADTGYVSGYILGWDFIMPWDSIGELTETYVDIKYVNGQVQLWPRSNISGSFNYYLLSSDGSQTYYSDIIVSGYHTYFTIPDIYNFHVHGNFRNIVDLPFNSSYDFSFTFGEDLDNFYNLRTIINQLTSQGYHITDMNSLLFTVKEYTIYNNSNLEAILAALQNQSAIIKQETNNVINNQNSNSDKVTSNQDKNTDKVTSNQDKNTDKVTNGWTDKSDIDNSVNESYYAADEELANKTAEARSSSVSFLNNFGALLNDTPISKGLLSVSTIMTQFFNIGWLSGLVNFSLSIGAFSFILGSVIMVVGKVSSNEKSKIRADYMSAKSAFYHSRAKYYDSRRKK